MSGNLSSASSHTIGKKLYVERGSSSSQSSKSGVEFTEVTLKESSQSASTQESFQQSLPAEVDYAAELRKLKLEMASKSDVAPLSSLSAEDRSLARKVAVELNNAARLFARNEENELVRIAPSTLKERLDSGQAVEVVTRVGTVSDTSSNYSRSSWTDDKFWGHRDYGNSSSRTKQSQVRAEYFSSPVSTWDGFLWHEGEKQTGIPGTPKLPASGQPVTISRSWEKQWAKSSNTSSGLFIVDTESNRASGHSSVREVAED